MGPNEAGCETLLRHADAAYAFALSLTGSAEAAEEVCQEAFLRALEAREPDARAMEERPRLMRFVYLTALSLRRSERRREARERRAVMEREFRRSGPGEAAAARERAERVHVAVAGLREELRAPVFLHYLQEMTCAEAGAVLGLTEKAVERRVERALSELRRTLVRAGFALAPGALLGALQGAPAVKAPAALTAKLGALTAGAKAASSGTAAGAALAAKGGLAMKIVAGIIAAGTLAGAVAVSTGALDRGSGPLASPGNGEPAPVNPYKGMQEREEIFEFTQKPEVKKHGDKWVITFASKGKCDATVSILARDGEIVRHLASGVLGKNAPYPFQQNSLSQKIEWDGLTDDFKKAPASCKVRVSLGLKAEFDKSIAYDPYHLPGDREGNVLVGTDAEGKMYVVSESRASVVGRVFGKDGKYLRTFFPPPAAEVEKAAPILGYKLGTTKWGDKVMIAGWFGPAADVGGRAGPTAVLSKLAGVDLKKGPRPKEIPAPTVPGAGAGASGKCPHLAADWARDEVYTGFGGQYRFSGETGELDRAWFPDPKANLTSNSPTSEVHIGVDGLVYLRFGIHGYGRHMFRLDHSGKPVPFKKENTVKVAGGSGWWERLPCAFKGGVDAVFCGVRGHSNTFAHGLYLSPSGRWIVAGIHEIDAKWAVKVGLAKPEEAKGAEIRGTYVVVFDGDGKLLTPNAVGMTRHGHGLTIDRDGNIYAVIAGIMPEGQSTLEGSDIPTKYRLQGGFGSLVKFRNRGGKFPLTTGPGVKVGSRGKASELPGVQWAYGGIVGQSAGDCRCNHIRHDMDFFARSWIPSNQLYSITVLDSNMNRIARIGRYGNVDDADEKCGKIHLAWPRAVAASDAALYVADHASRRVLRAALSYHVEEEVPLDGSASSSASAPAPAAPAPAAPESAGAASAPAPEASPAAVCRGWLSLARSYARAGRKDKAREYLERIIEQHPETEYAAKARRELAGL